MNITYLYKNRDEIIGEIFKKRLNKWEILSMKLVPSKVLYFFNDGEYRCYFHKKGIHYYLAFLIFKTNDSYEIEVDKTLAKVYYNKLEKHFEKKK